MQTFVPYPDWWACAKVLDNKRLGKQRVETLQILNALAGRSQGWVNHPATRMWRGHERTLAVYGSVMCVEWMERGFSDTCLQKIGELALQFPYRGVGDVPSWWGRADVHDSHKSRLLQKDPVWYGQFKWDVPTNLEYVWPV